MDVTAIPLTAWESAGIIVLFILFAGSLIGGVFALVRWVISGFSRIQREQQKDWQEYQEKRDALYNQEMEKRDKANRDFFTELNRATCEDGEKRLELTEKILEMVGAVLREQREHDDFVRENVARKDTITKRGPAK